MWPGVWPGVAIAWIPGAIRPSPLQPAPAHAGPVVGRAPVGVPGSGDAEREGELAPLDVDGRAVDHVAQPAGVVRVQVRDGDRGEVAGLQAVRRERGEQRVLAAGAGQLGWLVVDRAGQDRVAEGVREA